MQKKQTFYRLSVKKGPGETMLVNPDPFWKNKIACTHTLAKHAFSAQKKHKCGIEKTKKNNQPRMSEQRKSMIKNDRF